MYRILHEARRKQYLLNRILKYFLSIKKDVCRKKILDTVEDINLLTSRNVEKQFPRQKKNIEKLKDINFYLKSDLKNEFKQKLTERVHFLN